MKTHDLKPLGFGRIGSSTTYCGRYCGRHYDPCTGKPGVKLAALGENPTCQSCRRARRKK